MVAELYHNRWQIELFFKWIKQHLKIKKFWGTSENAVRIQIYSAITAYCMMAIMQKKMNIERSIYEMPHYVHQCRQHFGQIPQLLLNAPDFL